MTKTLDTKASSVLSKGLDTLLSGVVDPKDFARHLFYINLGIARLSDPKLAKVMLACAIPRSFDAKIIGVLRNAPKDYKTNKRLLEALKTFQFVLVRKDGDYVYHDNTRDVVLKDWESDKNRGEYEKLKRRLVAFYSTGAKKQLEKNKYVSALAEVNCAIELQPDDTDLRMILGKIHYRLRDYPSALIDFTEVIKSRPKDWNLYYWRGATKYYLRDYKAAIADLTTAIKVQPRPHQESELYSLRASAYQQLRRYEAARPDIAKAIKLSPNADNHILRAINYFYLADFKAALSDIDVARKLQPRNSISYYWRGAIYYELQDYQEAINSLTKAIKLDPKDGKSYTGRGISYFQLLNYKAALKDTEKAIKLEPGHSHNYDMRGMIYYRLRDYEHALPEFEKAISLQPENSLYYLGRGTCLLAFGKFSDAFNDFSQCIKLAPSKPQAFFWRGITSQLSGDKKLVKADWNESSKLAKAEKDVCVRRRMLARLDMMQGQTEDARKKYTGALNGPCEMGVLETELSHLAQLESLFSSRDDIRTTREWLEQQLRSKPLNSKKSKRSTRLTAKL